MNRLVRMGTVASALALVLPLAACSSWDPTDIVDNLFDSQKKPLQGERKELFPNGTPGVEQGLPRELVKGYQPPPADAAPSDSTGATAAAAEEPKPKPKAKPKPKPKVVAAPPPVNAPSTPASAAAAPASQGSPWPDPSTGRSTAPGQVAWPDPPPVTR